MSNDLAARLRALAHDHQAGRLSREAYRKLRAPLMDSLAKSGAAPMDDMAITQPRAAARSVASAPASRTADAVQQQAPPARSKAGTRATIVVFGLLLVAATAFMFIRGPVSGDDAPDEPVAQASPVRDVVQPFVERGDWSDTRVASLNVELLALGQRHMAAAAHEQWFQRFVEELRMRFKEQQALAPAPLTAHTSPLAALAVTVGLDLNSPDAAIRIPAADVPISAPHVATPAVEIAVPAKAAAAAQLSHAETVKAEIASRKVPATTETSEPMASATTPDAPRTSSCRAELTRTRRPFCSDALRSGQDGPQLAMVPAGDFQMGSVAAPTEQPVHAVRIAAPFAISVNEVSQAEFKAYCEASNASCPAQPWAGDDYPVVNVSWQDARAYTEWLSQQTGRRYRLPTEAEWEYAARAGQSGLLPAGDTLSLTDAHYSMLKPESSAVPRSQKFNANAFRLLHTLGNVREWVEDGWAEDFSAAPGDGSAVQGASSGLRVVRGGSYVDITTKLRLSAREGVPEDTRDQLTGFRVMREVP
jgi:formylglycine-generating enzyme required for sulfatase activity